MAMADVIMPQDRRIRSTAANAPEAGMSGPCPLDAPNGKLGGLAQVILTGCQGILKGLPDDVL